jgi:hypothetical protein
VLVWTFGERGYAIRRGGEGKKKLIVGAGEFARVRLGIEPDPVQMELLQSEAHRGILNCARQWGKSTVAAIRAVHHAHTNEKSLALVASPSRRQSAELMRKVTDMLAKLGIEPRGDGINVPSAVLPNGSRIVGLPGREDTVRGFSAVSLLLIDEAARVSDEQYKTLRPMLSVMNGDLWLMSTPNGPRGFFYEEWERGGPEWYRVSATATECPRISSEFLEEERSSLGADWFRQEYLCEFVNDGTMLFSPELVDAAMDDDLEPI